jgi:TetR/AcrR family transcriptional regulator, cholesterol catabolism regulator
VAKASEQARAPGTRRREIIEAAAELFGTQGYHATTIRQVADAAGILSGSLYAHIKSKEDLLYEIAILDAEDFIDTLGPIAESDEPAAERLREGLRAHLELVSRYGQQARLFLLEVKEIETPERREHVVRLRDEYEALWARILENGQQEGTFADVDVGMARIAIMSVANWAYLWLDPKGRLTPADVADRFSRILLEGLLKPT